MLLFTYFLVSDMFTSRLKSSKLFDWSTELSVASLVIRVDSGNQSYDVFFTSVITYIRKHSKQTNWNHHVFSNYIGRVKTRVL